MSETTKPKLRHRNGEVNQSTVSMTMSDNDNDLKQSLILNTERESGEVGRKIGVYDEAPEHNKYLIYILTGYRVGFTTFKDCLRSLFLIHNETVNVWTHLFGSVMYILFAIYVLYFMPTVQELHHIDSNSSFITEMHKYYVEEILGFDTKEFIMVNLPVYPIILH